MRLVPSIIFSLIAYFMTGLQRTAGQFLVFLLTVLMASVFGSANCLMISASISTFCMLSFRSKNKSFSLVLDFFCSSGGSYCCCSYFRYYDII